ncbi:MAG TPA: BatA domain-containing protein, partial [Roseiarcus sp.]
MFGLPLAFAAPAVLAALVGLVGLYFLLRVTPPSPRQAIFPPLRLLIGLDPTETTPARMPWSILALRLAIGALIILAMAQPLWNSLVPLSGSGPLLVLIDDGFAAASGWDKRIDFARERAASAERAGRIVALGALSEGGKDIAPLDGSGLDGRLRSLAPVPYAPERAAALPAIERFLSSEPHADILWIADGVELGGASAFSTRLASIAHSVEVVTDSRGALALAGADNEAGALTTELTRSDARGPATGVVRALDAQGQEVGRATFDFGADSEVDAHFDLPVELRNDVTQVVIDGERSAGAAWLIDERSRRRRVAIASGASADVAQPLLAPSYYLKRALQPFADISEWHDTSTDPIVSLLDQKPSVLVLADMSVAPGPELEAITQFLANGGVLLRFAGTRLAAGEDTLTPTALRSGGRLLGGALSWETPKHIAPFETSSPFFGLAASGEVTVTRQVLAEPDAGLSEKTWARLADGTPLVTAERRGKGLIVLFHVTADTTWSNLPLSGLFVDMLRRIVAEADGPGHGTAGSVKTAEHGIARPPLRTLNGFGVLGPPPAQAEPIHDDFSSGGDMLHPPGFYGARDSLRAVNALTPGEKLVAAKYAPLVVHEGGLALAPPVDLRRWLLPAALVGLMIDALVSIWLMGGAPLRRNGAIAVLAVVGLLGFGAVPQHVRAAESPPVSERDMDAALSTRLASVATGDSSVDETSKLGLTALTR